MCECPTFSPYLGAHRTTTSDWTSYAEVVRSSVDAPPLLSVLHSRGNPPAQCGQLLVRTAANIHVANTDDTGISPPPHSSSSPGAATILRQSGNILDIAKAVCSRSHCVLGFVSQHRVHLLVKGPCRTANSCKPGLVVIACNVLCTAARFHAAEDRPGCRLGCLEELDCLRHYNCCPILFDHLNSLWPGTNECIHPTADRLCTLVSGLLDAFDLRRTHGGLDRFVSGVGPYIPDDVLGFHTGTTPISVFAS